MFPVLPPVTASLGCLLLSQPMPVTAFTFDAVVLDFFTETAISVDCGDSVGGLIRIMHHLKVNPTMPKSLAEPRDPEDWEIAFIMTHVNQLLRRGEVTDRKHVRHCLKEAVRALPKNEASEEVQTAACPQSRPLDASTRDGALRVERAEMRRQLQAEMTPGKSLYRADAFATPLTSEEALQLALAQGLTLRVGKGKTGCANVHHVQGANWPYTAGNSPEGGGGLGCFATAEEAALRVAQEAARRVARTAELTSEDERLAQQLAQQKAQRKAQRLAPRGKRKATASLKEEEVIPPMPSDAIVKEELMVAPIHSDATVKEEGILVPPMPPDAFVKHEVVENDDRADRRPKKQRKT